MNDYRYFLRGDCDLAAAPAVRADLQLFVATSAKHLLVDSANLTFIDSTGIAVLLETHRDLTAVGRYMLICNVPFGPRRVFELLGLSDLLHYDPPERTSRLLTLGDSRRSHGASRTHLSANAPVAAEQPA